VGTASGAATGAAIGAIGGPVGAVIGAVAGGVIGGLAGGAVAESIDPRAESEYWEKHYRDRPYVEAGTFEDFGPAYQYGWQALGQHAGKSFDEVEPHLEAGWDTARGTSSLEWGRARHAARDAWERLHRLSHLEINEHGVQTPP
jgi:hypothetical protein